MKNYLPIAAFCLMAASCTPGKQSAEQTAGIRLANLDTLALPGTDFYQYACGGWMKDNPLTGEYSRFGSFDQLAENNRKQLQDLIDELSTQKQQPGSVGQKIGDLYNMVLDSVKLNADGVAPIRKQLNEIAALNSADELCLYLARMHRNIANPYFAVYVAADAKNSSMNSVQTYQTGLSMGERDYYLENDEATTKIREAFKIHVPKMMQLAGFDKAVAQKTMEVVMDVETRLAKVYRSRTELRDPEANYNKMTYEELKKEFALFNWDAYLPELGLTEVKEIIVGQPASLKAAVEIINTLPLDEQKLYLQWNLVNSAASYLNDELYAQNFDFYSRTMSGTQEMKPRWKRAVGAVNGALGEAVGQMYVEKYFPAAAKERMVTLVKNLQESLGQRIRALSWMGDETKAKALEKLAAFRVKIGYPDTWKDYSTLEIKDDSYWDNMLRASLWQHNEMIAKAGKPVDKTEWLMTPQTVNAYYMPTTNEICFPAGILQYPFFDMNADDAFNYGAIGVVIGHEMTHGFDDKGRLFDKDGNLKTWWTEEDAKRFDERAQVMVDFFNAIEVAPGVHANGEMTLGENIADHGGLQIAFQAFQNATAGNPLPEKEGFTPEQRFFLAYANVWAGNIRPEAVLNLTKVDVHSLGKWRVDGALPHINAWNEAFGITEESPMYLPVEKRASIW